MRSYIILESENIELKKKIRELEIELKRIKREKENTYEDWKINKNLQD